MCWAKGFEDFITDNYGLYKLENIAERTEIAELRNLKLKIAKSNYQ